MPSTPKNPKGNTVNLIIDGPTFMTLVRALNTATEVYERDATRLDRLGLPDIADADRTLAARTRELSAEITTAWCEIGLSGSRTLRSPTS